MNNKLKLAWLHNSFTSANLIEYDQVYEGLDGGSSKSVVNKILGN